ncbi:hypothetical protein [Pedobacter sp.]|uniref:hypothetical protein n=1 Tax=Pedobacter sp. TaxID=1411316 RepID=UPI003BACF19A
MKKHYSLIFSVCVLCFSFSLKAQDSHYWSSNFSAAGFLAPGATVVNNLDSGVYYLNPALMAWSSKTATSISANVYDYSRVKITNGVGHGKDLTATSTRIIPQLVSKTFKLNKDHPLTFGFALIQNPMQDFRASQRMDKRINVLNDSYSPGNEAYVGQFDQNSKVTETYAQLSAGIKISKKLALGATVEGNIRKQVVGSNFSSKAIFNNDPGNTNAFFPKVASNEIYTQSNYTHMGLKLKLGASYESAAHHFGLVLSSPQLKLHGTGAVLSDLSINNLTFNGTNIDLNILASTRQTKLKTTWKTPLSIAAGYAYDYGKGQINLTAEFFAGLKSYTILKADDALFIKNSDAQAPVDTDQGSLDLNDERKRIFNIGMGYSRSLNPTVVLMMPCVPTSIISKPGMNHNNT